MQEMSKCKFGPIDVEGGADKIPLALLVPICAPEPRIKLNRPPHLEDHVFSFVNVAHGEMDPITIISLVATCSSIATRVISAIHGLDDIITKIRNADRSASRLAAQLRLFNATVDQLKQWLDRTSIISRGLEATMKSALGACEDVVADIEEHIKRVVPAGADGRMSLVGRIRYRWDEKTIQEYESMLATQFQTFDLFIRLLSLNNPTDQDSVLESATSQKLLFQSFKDAQTIRETTTIASSLDERSGVTSMQFDFDDPIVQSGPYLKNYRDLLRGKRTSGSSEATQSPRRGSAGQASISKSASSGSSQPQKFSLSSVLSPFTGGRRGGSRDAKLILSELCQACRDGHAEWAETLIGEGVDVSGVDERSLSPLYYAICSEKLSIVQLLVDHGAEINGGSGKSSALLSAAVQKDNIDIVRYLLESGAEVNSHCFDGRKLKSPLFSAVERGKLESARVLLSHNADIRQGERNGLDPLCCAVDKGHRAIVQLLLEHGANVNSTESQADWGTGVSALHVAACRSTTEIVEDLLSAGADVSAMCQQKSVSGITALHLAKGQCAEVLIRNGAKIFARDSSGQFPLSAAVQAGDIEAVGANLRHNAPVNARDRKGNTALHLALKMFAKRVNAGDTDLQNYVDIVNELLQAGANTEAKRVGRSILLQDCQRYLQPPGVRRAPLSLVEVMDQIVKAAEERATSAISSPTGVRNMPRGIVGDSFLAMVVTRPLRQAH